MMGILDKLTGKDSTDGLPDMLTAPSPGQVVSAQQGSKDFRAREKAAAAAQTQATAAAENEGLPSVNRRKGNSKMVTALGFVVILGAAGAMIVGVNSDKKPKPRRQSEEKVSNNLPPIAIPATPPPIQITPAPAAQIPAIRPGAPGAQPIALHGGGRQPGPGGKAPLDWTERKMGGALVVYTQGNGGGAAAATPATGVRPFQLPDTALAAGGNPLFTGPPGLGIGAPHNELAAKLEPTITRGVSASMLPDRNFLITKGTSLDCALETALDSSVPGITTCRLTRDVYSDNGQVLLLDRGSQLVGEYQSGIKQGQVRLFVLWTRAKTPNGVIVSLNSPGTDALGRSGLEGWVDNHFMERFGAAILMSLIKDSVTAIANRSGSGGTTNYYGNSAQGGEKIVEKILDSTVNIPPTIIKNQGDHIQVMVARDLDFSGVYALKSKP